jgi:hypothetical protein
MIGNSIENKLSQGSVFLRRSPTMAAFWSRNPRYVVFILVAIATTLYLMGPFQDSPVGPPPPVTRITQLEDHDLPNRLARSDRIYNKLLLDRKELIK